MYPNQYQHRIEKEEVNQLPLVEFKGEVVIVRDETAFAEAIDYLQKQSCVGVDTETRPSFVKGQHYPTALVQIATTQRCYLFQLKHLGFRKELAELFANPQICKVGLAFKDDLNGLQRLHRFTPSHCIDIQKMVLKYGILDLGLQKIFAIVFQKKISKAQQLTNWENATLTAEQARYAATDAWATLLIYKRLKRTKKLPQPVYMQLREEDLKRQLQHQQEVLAEKEAEQEQQNEKQHLNSEFDG